MTDTDTSPAWAPEDDSHPRWQRARIERVLQIVRVAILVGARGSGKTALAYTFESDVGEGYLNLEDEDLRDAVRGDMRGYVDQGHMPLIIDEHHLIPDIRYAIKISADRDQRRGRFLLTSSVDPHSVPGVRESLAGRAWTVRLRTLARGEVLGSPPSFLHRAFNHTFREREGSPDHLHDPGRNGQRDGYLSLALAGGYPDALELECPKDRGGWHRDHIERLLSRDLRSIVNLRRKPAARDLIRSLAAWSSKGIDLAKIGRGLKIARPTLESYVEAMEDMYLIDRVRVWADPDRRRGKRRDRLFMADSGLMAGALGWTLSEVQRSGDAIARLLKTYAYNQVAAVVDVNKSDHRLFYYQDHDGHTVDFVVRNGEGDLLGIDVASATSPVATDARHLHWFGENLAKGRSFTGLVLHPGKVVRQLAGRVWAVPISYLWE